MSIQRVQVSVTMSAKKDEIIMIEDDGDPPDSSSDDELQVVSEHLVPNAGPQLSGQAINLPAGLQAKLLAAVRASNIQLPAGASKIKIFTKDTDGTSGGNCRIIMSQNGESNSRSTFSIPFAELNQATPSTSKGSRVGDLNTPPPEVLSPPPPELVDLETEAATSHDESQTSKKPSSIDRSDEHPRSFCQFEDLFMPRQPKIKSARSSTDTKVSQVKSPPQTRRKATLEKSDFLTELAKVHETINNFDKDSELSDDFGSDLRNDFEDEFRSASTLSVSKGDSDRELQNLIDSDDESEKPTTPIGDVFSMSLSPRHSNISRPETRSSVGSLRLSSDSGEGDIEEGQVVSIESSDEDSDDVVEIVTMNDSEPEVQSCHSDDDDQFVSRDQTQISLQKNILCNLELIVIGSSPFLAVSTFEQLFDNFCIDTGKLVKLLENLGESVQDHLVFQNWGVTHISFFAAKQILSLAGGEPKFLQSFLTHTKPSGAYIDVAEFRISYPKFEKEEYFSKTKLSACNSTEFKAIFGLVSHSEARDIRDRAKIVKRRLLRPQRKQDDFLNKRKKPEQTEAGKKRLLIDFLKPQTSRRKTAVNNTPIISYKLNPRIKEISQPQEKVAVHTKPKVSTSPIKEEIKREREVEIVEDTVEMFEVKQTREMKRKGIKLPRGWKIFGRKRESETKSNGHVYQYFRIDWQFKAPDGKSYKSLKKALDVVKHNTRHEKWEVFKPKSKPAPPPPSISPRKILETFSPNSDYVTLKKQAEQELDLELEKDVFALSGVRPVRKFPDNVTNILSPRDKIFSPVSPNAQCPQRMTAAVLKTNPVTPAQYEQMMRKSAIPINRFRLSQIGEVIGPKAEGWFSSKIETLRRVSNSVDVRNPLSHFHHCLARNGWSVVTSMPKTQEGKVVVQIFSETEDLAMMDLDRYIFKLRTGSLYEDKESRANDNIDIPQPVFRHKAVKSSYSLPAGWLLKFLGQDNSYRRYSRNIRFISPDGLVFKNIESVIAHLQEISQPLYRSPKKSSLSATLVPRKLDTRSPINTSFLNLAKRKIGRFSVPARGESDYSSPHISDAEGDSRRRRRDDVSLPRVKSLPRKYFTENVRSPGKRFDNGVTTTAYHSPERKRKIRKPSKLVEFEQSFTDSEPLAETKPRSKKKAYVKIVRSLPRKFPVNEIIAENKAAEEREATRHSSREQKIDWSTSSPRARNNQPAHKTPKTPASTRSRKTATATGTPENSRTHVRRTLLGSLSRRSDLDLEVNSSPYLKRSLPRGDASDGDSAWRVLHSTLGGPKVPTGSPARKKKRMTETQILALISGPNDRQPSPEMKRMDQIMTRKRHLSEKSLPSEKNESVLSPEIMMLSPNEKMVLDEDLNVVGAGNAGWGGSSRSTPDSLEDLLADSDDDSKPTDRSTNSKDPVEDDLDTFVNSDGSNLVDSNSSPKSRSTRKSVRRKQ